MSEQAIEIAERAGRAWESGVAAALRDLEQTATADIEWVEDASWPGARSCRGFAEIRELVAERTESFEFEQRFERALAAGKNQAVILMRWRGRGKASGAATERPFAVLITTRDDRVSRIEFFLDPDRALKAAGLRD